MESNVWIAFGLTAFAGLSTGIGSAIAFFSKTANKAFLGLSLGFSAGVMIYVSLMEIVPKAQAALAQTHGPKGAAWIAVAGFFGGLVLTGLIDRVLPDYENPHHAHLLGQEGEEAPDPRLMRMGLFTALAIGIHNFPEGLATFMTALREPGLALPIVMAIAIHNIPEGVSVSVPIFYATGNRSKAFWLSFASGLAEPVGAVVGYTILRPFFSPTVFGFIFASVAGIMVYISLDELLPNGRLYGGGHGVMYGLIAGMAVMALSLLLFL